MKVQMIGKLLEREMFAKGFNSPIEAANKIGCDARTFKRAINGFAVLQKTAIKICSALDIDPSEAIIFNPRKDASSVGEEKRGINNPSLAEICAYDDADQAMRDTLNRFERYDQEGISSVLTMLLSMYGTALAQQNSPNAFYFIDDIANKAKTAVRMSLLAEESEDTSTQD